MKWLKRIGCGAIVLLLVLIVAGAVTMQVVLKSQLTKIIQNTVIPAAEKKLKVNVDVGSASVNIMGGSVSVQGVKLGNPAGFEEPDMFSLERFIVDVNLGRLINGFIKTKKLDVEVRKVEIRDAAVTVVRNADKLINVKVLADSLNAGKAPAAEPEEKPEPEETPEPEAQPVAEKKPVEIPPFHLRTLDINTLLTYVDHAMGGKAPMSIALKSQVNVRDISSYDVGRQGQISITGSLAGNSEVCKTDLKGHIAPITDPLKATFDFAGDVGAIDLQFVRPYMQMAGFGCDSLSLKLNIVCKDGIIDGKQSLVTFMMTKVVFSGNLAKNLPPGVDYFEKMTVPVPIEGPLTAPKVDVGGAVARALVDNVKDNVGGMVKGAVTGLLLGGKDSKDKGGLVGGLLGGGDKGATNADVKGQLLGGLLGGGDKGATNSDAKASALGGLLGGGDKGATNSDAKASALGGLLGGGDKESPTSDAKDKGLGGLLGGGDKPKADEKEKPAAEPKKSPIKKLGIPSF